MNSLFYFEEIGLKITWKLIFLGLSGTRSVEKLQTYELIEYISKKLDNPQHISESTINLLIQIIINEPDQQQLLQIIKKCADTESSDIIIQERKWRLLGLIRLMKSNDKDSVISRFFDLYDFWSEWSTDSGIPFTYSNDPHITQQNLSDCKEIVDRNLQWIQDEIVNIVSIEFSINDIFT